MQAYNERDVERYVDLLIPSYYGGKEEYKKYIVKAYKNMLESDDRRLEEINVRHSIEKEGKSQIPFSASHGNSETFFLGVVDNKNKLKLSTLFSSNMRIDQITEKIPDLDHSFYDLIEPGWKNVKRFKVGEKIPELKWTSISGKEINPSEMSDQTIVLNFWHTTCPPCIKEIPELNQLVTKFPKVSFIAPISDIDVDYLQNKFLTKHDSNYDVVIVKGKNYNVYSFPQHIVIKNSEVVEVIKGYSIGHISKLEMAIKEAIELSQ